MKQSKIVAKIRKLLALARSNNEHEAAAAAARAAELMAAHHIAEATFELQSELEIAEEPIDEHILESASRASSWKKVLIGGLAYAFSCRSILRRATNLCAIVVLGRSSDVDALRYMWSYLTAEIDRLADEQWRLADEQWRAVGDRRCSARSWKNSFRISAAAVVAHRLRHAREQAFAQARSHPQGTAALVKIDAHEEALDARLEAMNLRRGSPVRLRANSGFEAGRRAGESMNLGENPGLGRPARQLGDRSRH